MRRHGLFVVPLFLLAQAAFCQSLVGTWVSDNLVLSMVRFSLTLRPDMTYEIDTVLGKTTGVYRYEGDRIIFTPIKVGINGGSAGDTDVYSYALRDDDILYLDSKGNEVKLIRAKS